jgi:hypothetical protein
VLQVQVLQVQVQVLQVQVLQVRVRVRQVVPDPEEQKEIAYRNPGSLIFPICQ